MLGNPYEDIWNMTPTFISPFESSPIYWAKLWPCGKLWSPGNTSVAAILMYKWLKVIIEVERNDLHLPMIDFALYLICMLLPMCFYKVLYDPCNEVIFESALDHLVQEIPWDKFIYVDTREITSKGLWTNASVASEWQVRLIMIWKAHSDLCNNPIILSQNLRV